MYLKRLEMQGFKSFVDKVNVDFVNGITAVVGPNGSGKSNISDGIRWVMGEQSAKSLRGSKMEDVIFAGTEKRKPTGFAEVTLTLDNSSRVFGVDFDEVAVTRRVFRSGESEYLINKAQCRLKDIHELFMDTGLGRDGYSIIGQGKIDEVLSAKSEDRRQMFEEAAGVSKYKYRKVEAERKLESTEENLVRIRDIITELENQVDPLRIQAEKAKRYLSLRDELKDLEINLFLVHIESGKKQLKELEEKYDISKSDLEKAKEKLYLYEEKTEKLYDGLKEKDDVAGEHRQAVHELELFNAKLESEIEILKNNIKNAQETLERLTGDGKDGKSKEEEFLSSIEETKEEAARILKSRDELLVKLGELENKARELQEESIEMGTEIEKIRDEIVSLQQMESDAKNKVESFDILCENYQSSIETCKCEQKNAQRKLEDVLVKIEEIKSTLAIKEHEYQKTKNEWNKAVKEQKDISEEVNREKEEYNRLSAEWNQKQSRYKALREMENNMEGYSKSVKELINAHQKGELQGVRMMGVLSKLLETPDEYITAIEIALAAAAQNIVVETEEDAKAAIEYLKEQKLGRATFLPISTVKGKGLEHLDEIKACDGYIGIASELITFDSCLTGVVEQLLKKVVVVQNIDHAISMAKKFNQGFKIVTLSGELINPGGAISGGSKNKGGGIFGREKEIERLEKECKTLEKKLEKIDDKIEDLIERQNDCTNGISRLRDELSEKESELVKTEGSIRLQEQMKENLDQENLRILEEITAFEEKIKKTKEEQALYGNQSIDFKKTVEGKETALVEAQEKFQEMMKIREANNEHITETKMDISLMEKDAEVHLARKEELESLLSDYRSGKEQELALIESTKASVLAMNETILTKRAEIEENLLKMNEHRTCIDGIILEKEGENKEIQKIREETKALTEMIFSLQEECTRMESKIAKVEGDLEGITTRMWEDYEMTISTAYTLKNDELNIPEAQKRAKSIRGEMKGMGNINVDAIDEYKSVSERYEFLSGQRNDLEEAKNNLTKIIADLTGTMKTQFAQQFEVIRKEFNNVFVELFGGGKADLVIADDSDILNSGIEIEVQPPGKKLQNLSLLSGGERAFTAIALLFAILRVRPTPFCILDEIEAALDDVNVYRFADYLKKYSDKTQFIIITHRRGTMEAANILYGITMQEKGVSKLLAMNLDEVEQ